MALGLSCGHKMASCPLYPLPGERCKCMRCCDPSRAPTAPFCLCNATPPVLSAYFVMCSCCVSTNSPRCSQFLIYCPASKSTPARTRLKSSYHNVVENHPALCLKVLVPRIRQNFTIFLPKTCLEAWGGGFRGRADGALNAIQNSVDMSTIFIIC